jgi:HNH endonuclease
MFWGVLSARRPASNRSGGAQPVSHLNSYAKDRGCTFPGCTVPGYLAEVHHVDEWAAGGETNIDNLTLACGGHHRLHEKGWKTRKRRDGTTEWIPPPHAPASGRYPHDGKPRTNNYHHPDRYLRADDDEDDE